MAESNDNSEVAGHNSESHKPQPPTAKVTPSRKAYDSVASDVGISSAIGELLDNSLDSAALQGINPVRVTIEHRTTDDGTEELVYRDAAGGVAQSDMGVFLGLGRSREERADDQNVGTFGIGAKKALKRLGDRLIIGSRHSNADQGWQYTVPPEWFEVEDDDDDPGQWEFPLTPVDLDPGVTELRIQELSFDWEHHKEEVVDWVRTTYRKFLDPHGDIDLTLELTIIDEDVRQNEDNDGRIEPPADVEWTYSPWLEGLHPRLFKGLEFHDPDWTEPIQARVTVGLLREGSSEQSGTFIYCQNRLIESGLTDEKGGFGVTRDSLNQFQSAQHKRLRIEIELFGDASDLPWNSDKSRIRSTHKALSYAQKGVYWWLRRMADRHMAAGKYGAFDHSAAIFEPYNASSEYVQHTEPEPIDISDKHTDIRQGKKDQIRIYDKPAKSFDEIRDLIRIATVHAQLGVTAASMTDIGFADWARPAYEYMVGSEFQEAFYDKDEDALDPIGGALVNIDATTLLEKIAAREGSEEHRWAVVAKHLPTVTELPDAQTCDLSDEREQLSSAAAEDLDRGENGERRTAMVAWRQPRYEAELRRLADRRDIEFESLEPVADPIEYDDPTTRERSEGGDQASDAEAPRPKDDSEKLLECQECGAELTGDTCDECGFEYDIVDEDENGSVSTVSTDQALTEDEFETSDDREQSREESNSSAQADEQQLTLASFCREHADLFDDDIKHLLDDDEALAQYLAEYIRAQQETIEIANEYINIDRLTEVEGVAKAD